MITLEPDFVGALAAPAKLQDGSAQASFARFPRLDRLRAQGKADDTETPLQDDGADTASSDDDTGDAAEPVKSEKTLLPVKHKKKARGKESSMKRYLKKSRDNVTNPLVVCWVYE